MKRKVVMILAVILVVAIAGGIVWWESTHGNRQLVDTKYRFDTAVIRLPDGEIVRGKVSSWLDFDDSDVIQVTVEGKTYLTSYVNVCLIQE